MMKRKNAGNLTMISIAQKFETICEYEKWDAPYNIILVSYIDGHSRIIMMMASNLD